MKTEQQRIAIAEACGWTIHQIYVDGSPDVAILPPGVKIADDLAVWNHAGIDIPDYLNDLNAIHEAEKVLTLKQQRVFAGRLRGLSLTALRLAGDHLLDDFDLAHATAAQRAEAFLRTIGKWEESK